MEPEIPASSVVFQESEVSYADELIAASLDPVLRSVNPDSEMSGLSNPDNVIEAEKAADGGSQERQTVVESGSALEQAGVVSKSTKRKSKQKTPAEDASAPKTKKAKDQEGPVEYITDSTIRRRAARETGEALQRKVQKFATQTGAKVYLKIEYDDSECVRRFRVGDDFSMADDPITTISANQIKTSVLEGVSEALLPFKRFYEEGIGKQDPPVTAGDFLSPVKLVSGPSQTCNICKTPEVEVEKMKYESEWIGCEAIIDGKPCINPWTHTACIGLPGMNSKDVSTLKCKFYCKLHQKFGVLESSTQIEAQDPRGSSSSKKARVPRNLNKK